jgi:hypothetical protein
MLSSAQENLAMLEQVANEIHDATSSDPVLVSIVSRLCTGISSQNNIIQYLLKNDSRSVTSSYEQVKIGPPVAPKPSKPTTANDNQNQVNLANAGNQQSRGNTGNSRKPLKQAPLGNSTGPWLEVTQRKKNRDNASLSDNNTGTESEKNAQGSEGSQVNRNSGKSSDPFADAVREAERSVVIYNLNLGQSPLLNPNTISAKVTTALINAAAENLKGECGNPTEVAGEMVNDLLSQVKGMNLFGKGTKPCKDPRNPTRNGSFYTVPVKLSFNNKQVAKAVNDLLRQKYKVSTSIPYHRTLKKAITLAHERISKLNTGKQVLISLDAANKCLKPFIRDPPAGARRSGPANWVAAGGVIALPFEAFDPKLKELTEDFSLPTSPTLVLNNPPRVNGQPYSGNTNIRLKLPDDVALKNGLAKQVVDDPESETESNEAGGSDSEDKEESGSPDMGENMEEDGVLQNEKNSPSGLRPDS